MYVGLSTSNCCPPSQEEEDLYLKIYEYSEAVIHLESSHTRIPAQTSSDKETVLLLHRYATVVRDCVGVV